MVNAYSLAASLGGSAIGGGLSYLGGVARNKAAKKAAREMMAFQKHMFQHRYQYTVDDMRAAGLNPMLAIMQGAGQSPSGASYTPENVLAGAGAAVGDAVPKALGAQAIDAQINKTKADTNVSNAQADLVRAQTETEPLRRALMDSQSGQAHSAMRLNQSMEVIKRVEEKTAWQNLEVAKKEAVIAGFETQLYEKGPGEVAKVLEMFGLKGREAVEIGRLLFQMFGRSRRR